jgi:hypothetical protein
MGSFALASPAVISLQGARRALDETRSFLRQRLTLTQLVVLAPRLALHAVPSSSAAELRMQSTHPSASGSSVRSIRPGHTVGELWPAYSAELTANDGVVLGSLLLFCDDRDGCDATSRRTASALAGQLEAALRRAGTRESARQRTSVSPAAGLLVRASRGPLRLVITAAPRREA